MNSELVTYQCSRCDKVVEASFSYSKLFCVRCEPRVSPMYRTFDTCAWVQGHQIIERGNHIVRDNELVCIVTHTISKENARTAGYAPESALLLGCAAVIARDRRYKDILMMPVLTRKPVTCMKCITGTKTDLRK